MKFKIAAILFLNNLDLLKWLRKLSISSCLRWYCYNLKLFNCFCCMRNEQWIHTRYRTMKFLPTQVSWIWCKCLQSSFIHSKIFQSDWIQRGIVKKITAQMLITHMWKNADLKYWGQFNKTFKSVIYKCSYCFRILKQWLHLKITLVKVLLNWPMVAATTLRIV